MSDGLFAFWDFMPTFAELAGIEPPTPIDGISIVPTLLGRGEQMEHKYLYFRMGNKKRIIRGKAETRTDEEIDKEANTDVVVPKFTRRPVTPITIPNRPLWRALVGPPSLRKIDCFSGHFVNA